MVKRAFKDAGNRYLHWAGDLALNSKADVPWMMCKQNAVPGPIVSYISICLNLKKLLKFILLSIKGVLLIKERIHECRSVLAMEGTVETLSSQTVQLNLSSGRRTGLHSESSTLQ